MTRAAVLAERGLLAAIRFLFRPSARRLPAAAVRPPTI